MEHVVGTGPRRPSAAERLGAVVAEAVTDARAAGLGWDEVGAALGVPAEVAQARFGAAVAREPSGTGAETAATPPAPAAPERTATLGPVTLFTEMERLARAGRHGWRVVGAGTAIYLMTHTGQRWEFRRVPGGRGERALLAQGWQRIGSGRFPWAYYQRPTGRPADPEDVVGGYLVEP